MTTPTGPGTYSTSARGRGSIPIFRRHSSFAEGAGSGCVSGSRFRFDLIDSRASSLRSVEDKPRTRESSSARCESTSVCHVAFSTLDRRGNLRRVEFRKRESKNVAAAPAKNRPGRYVHIGISTITPVNNLCVTMKPVGQRIERAEKIAVKPWENAPQNHENPPLLARMPRSHPPLPTLYAVVVPGNAKSVDKSKEVWRERAPEKAQDGRSGVKAYRGQGQSGKDTYRIRSRVSAGVAPTVAITLTPMSSPGLASSQAVRPLPMKQS